MSDKIWHRKEVESPCVKICVIHEESGLCTGCLRTLDEIAAWSRMSADERRSVMAQLPDRRSEIAKRRGGRRGHLARRG